MKRTFFLTIGIGLVLAVAIYGVFTLLNQSKPQQEVQEHIEATYSSKDHLIHAYPNKATSQYLSESVGLYMNYLLQVDDQARFEDQVKLLSSKFIVKEGDHFYIKWALDPKTSANALVDDTRIIAALKKGAQQFKRENYEQLATKLQTSIVDTQRKGGYYTDYVNWSQHAAASRITLSYLTDDFFRMFAHTTNMVSLLKNADGEPPFFPEYYDVAQHRYYRSSEVHMVDQLLIAINRQQRDVASPAFQKWISQEWQTKKRITGRYTRATAQPAVSYESLSVYAFLKEYFELIDQPSLAKEVAQHAKKLAKGSFLKEAHFFDYMLFEEKLN
ncbi:hypothetical protein A374_19235 [Fictibacillus macauensis ZFHKF-1]|uniref:Glycoside transferase n=1 Tax=Fictibacillus macauensis ZFHKF-1 TaxID=1196324 RepID=I8U9Q2_9BACL|nr:hypothetical protein [Fictibacillus macauensis]EIT83685.1 hypothetical protein A374_19235 [Fictibacillus macauensis ZFHKF-1]